MKMPPDISSLALRDATEADAEVIAEIHNETIVSRANTMDLEPKTPEAIVRQIQDFRENEVIILLEREETVIGWGIIKRYSPKVGYRFAGETSVFLRHSEFRKGYGTYLKKALIARCRRMGYHHLVARIWASNTASMEYNRRLGYEMVGIQREIGFVDGRWVDVAVMQLILDGD